MLNIEDNHKIDNNEQLTDHNELQIDDVISNGISGQDDSNEYLFTIDEAVVFRGTDDLKFKLMLVTKDLKRDKADVKTKVFGNF